MTKMLSLLLTVHLKNCSCGPKSKAPADKEDSKEADDKEEEEPKLEEAVWEAKLKFLQVTLRTHMCWPTQHSELSG